MITKRSFAELIITDLSGGDISMRNKYDERDVFLKADMVIAQLIANEYSTKKLAADAYINGNYVKPFENVKPKFNNNRKESYFDLPAEMIALDNDKGLRQVSFMEGQDQPFIILGNGAVNTYDVLGTSSGLDTFEIYVEGPKVFIPKMPKGYACKLLVKMICSTSTLDPDELLRVPAQMEAVLYEMVMKMFGVNKATMNKQGNDSNPNTF
jgi:hypothetical protein